MPEDLYLLLKKAEYLGIEIVIVPKNKNYTAEKGDTLVSSTWLKELVENQTADIPDECILQTTGTAECRIADDTENDNSQTGTGDNNDNTNNPSDNDSQRE